jgi:hypothetical protein
MSPFPAPFVHYFFTAIGKHALRSKTYNEAHNFWCGSSTG